MASCSSSQLLTLEWVQVLMTRHVLRAALGSMKVLKVSLLESTFENCFGRQIRARDLSIAVDCLSRLTTIVC